jgi:DNA-binding beta-propeller fold protein YncE
VAVAEDGSLFVSELGNGRVSKVDTNGSVSSVVEGLTQPLAIALRQGALLILDHGTKTLESVNLTTQQQHTLATQLPVGNPAGLSRGPMDFAGSLAVDPDGTIYIPGDGEGSVLMLQQQ